MQAGVKVFENNKGAVDLARNPRSSRCMKHIDVRTHFIRHVIWKKNQCWTGAMKQAHAGVLSKPFDTELAR